MSSSLAGGMQNGAITAQDEAYLPRKKKTKPRPTPYQWHHESVSHLLEKPLNLAAVFYPGIFQGLAVNQDPFVGQRSGVIAL